MTNSLTARGTTFDIPDEPDWARMRSEIGARLRAAMAEHGVDAVVLLMNGYVGYATGASWPLVDAGLSHAERPVAVVLADDEHPHLFMPYRGGGFVEPPVPDDHLHGPVYLEFNSGVEQFARQLAELIPPGAAIAVDELTGAMRRSSAALFPSGPPSDAAIVVGAAQLRRTRRPDNPGRRWRCVARRSRSVPGRSARPRTWGCRQARQDFWIQPKETRHEHRSRCEAVGSPLRVTATSVG
jgi:Xaa-Pro dipeptidase